MMSSHSRIDSPRSVKKEPQFIFVNISDPAQKRVPDVQKIIRSHTTHAQHVRRKDEDWSPHRKSRAYSPKSITAWAIDDEDGHELSTAKRRASQTSGVSDIQFILENVGSLTRKTVRSLSGVKRRETRRRSLGQSSSSSQESSSLPPVERLAVDDPRSPTALKSSPTEASECTSIDEERIQEVSPLCESPVDGIAINPYAALEAYTNNLDTNMAIVLDHFTKNIRVQSPDFELKYAIEHDALQNNYIPFVVASPLLLAATTLLTISHLRYILGQPHATLALLRLRGFVLDSLHAALANPSTALQDETLVSVALMATYEALYGLRENHHIHMIGLARMVELRGGLRELGLNGLLDPLMLWYDANTSGIVGSSLYLKGLRSAGMYRQANREVFLLGVVPSCIRLFNWN